MIAQKAKAETEQEANEIEEKIQKIRVNLQLFANKTNEAETGGQETSRFYTNSILNSLFIPENVKEMLDEMDFMYNTESNEGQLKAAADAIGKDMQGVIDRIKKAESLERGQTSAEAMLIEKIYIEEAKTTGDTSKVTGWLKTVRPKVTKTAQALQAIGMWKRFTTEKHIDASGENC